MHALLLTLALTTAQPHALQSKAPAHSVQLASVCFYKREELSGMNKICYYDCLGSLTAITRSATSLCPLTIDR